MLVSKHKQHLQNHPNHNTMYYFIESDTGYWWGGKDFTRNKKRAKYYWTKQDAEKALTHLLKSPKMIAISAMFPTGQIKAKLTIRSKESEPKAPIQTCLF